MVISEGPRRNKADATGCSWPAQLMAQRRKEEGEQEQVQDKEKKKNTENKWNRIYFFLIKVIIGSKEATLIKQGSV